VAAARAHGGLPGSRRGGGLGYGAAVIWPETLEMARQRASWDEYFMGLARVVATRATCDRKHVGAVLVRERTVLSTGYNGSIRGLPHCDDEGHMMENGHCVATVHAEANAIVQAAKNGVSIEGATIYTTASPCWPCFKLIANSGCKRIVFGEFYRDERIFEFAQRLGIELTQVVVGDASALPPDDAPVVPMAKAGG